MRIHARDRRKWFAANFGRSYFTSQPLINPLGVIGFALPCAVVLLVCAAVLFSDHHTLSGGMAIAFAGPVINLTQLRQNKVDWTKKAKQMLDAAEASGGFTDESKANYNELTEQIKRNNELLVAAEELEGREPNPAGQVAQADADRTRLVDSGIDKERARVRTINEVAAALKLRQSFANEHIDKGTSIEVFRRLAIDKKASDERAEMQRQGMSSITGTPASDPRLQDESDLRRFSMVGALLERFEPGAWITDEKERNYKFDQGRKQKVFEGAREYVGMSLLDHAKECLSNVGIRWQTKSKTEIVRLAFQSTSDFPYILADSANKSLRAGYEMMVSPWRLIAARRSAVDFKTMYELTLDQTSRLEQVKESGEFTRGALIEGREAYAVKTYGKIVGITRQAIVNDDLGAFTRAPMLLGQEVGGLEGDTVVGIITANGTLSDSVALFDKNTHKNYDDSAGAISVDNIGALRVKMMLQTSSGGKVLGIIPKFLVVPATKEQLALQYTSGSYQASESAKINPWANTLQPVVLHQLDASDVNDWYLFADPNTPNGVVVVYAYLEGQEGPYTETRQGFDVDGVEIKIRLDFGAGAVDYRGAVRKSGA